MKKSPYLKTSFLLILLILCTSLYAIGFWSTIEFNGLVLFSFTEILITQTYPFFYIGSVVLIVAAVFDAFTQFIFKLVYKNDSIKNEEWSTSKKIVNHLAYAFIQLFLLWISYNIIDDDEVSWLIAPFLIWLGFSHLYVRFFLGSDYQLNIESRLTRYSFLIILYAFAAGKYEGMKIQNNIEYEYIVSNSDTLKIIAGTKSQLILSSMDNHSRRIVLRDTIASDYYYHERIYKRDTLNDLERLKRDHPDD